MDDHDSEMSGASQYPTPAESSSPSSNKRGSDAGIPVPANRCFIGDVGGGEKTGIQDPAAERYTAEMEPANKNIQAPTAEGHTAETGGPEDAGYAVGMERAETYQPGTVGRCLMEDKVKVDALFESPSSVLVLESSKKGLGLPCEAQFCFRRLILGLETIKGPFWYKVLPHGAEKSDSHAQGSGKSEAFYHVTCLEMVYPVQRLFDSGRYTLKDPDSHGPVKGLIGVKEWFDGNTASAFLVGEKPPSPLSKCVTYGRAQIDALPIGLMLKIDEPLGKEGIASLTSPEMLRITDAKLAKKSKNAKDMISKFGVEAGVSGGDISAIMNALHPPIDTGNLRPSITPRDLTPAQFEVFATTFFIQREALNIISGVHGAPAGTLPK